MLTLAKQQGGGEMSDLWRVSSDKGGVTLAYRSMVYQNMESIHPVTLVRGDGGMRERRVYNKRRGLNREYN